VRTLRGELVSRAADRIDDPAAISEVRWRFVTTDAGDFRLSGLSRTEELAYDADTGAETGYVVDPEGGTFAGERTGVALGWPDQGPAEWVLERQLGATVRALAAAGDADVREVEHDGRPAWELATAVRANQISEFSGDRLEITVDQRTGLPVRVVETRGGTFLRETRLERLVLDGPVEDSEFSVDVPPGVEASRTDVGWRRMTLVEATQRAGYAPPTPSRLPDGFRLARVAFAPVAGSTGAEGSNPITERAVALEYRRGLDRVLVTSRVRGDGTWADPLASGEGFVDTPERLTVTAGRLRGAAAELLVDPRAVPHVWALGSELVVTISGDLSRSELLAALESLS
jgi:hypothetical protein